MAQLWNQLTQHMAPLDWAIIVIYLMLALGLGLYHMKKAQAGIDNYFASGRSASWWLLGTSMVATTFAADTPLAVSGWVIGTGIANNWFWWCWVMGTMLGVFFFSRLWRRAGVLTDNELTELRYSGQAAGFLRGFRAIYFGILYNCIVIGWVNLAMTKILMYTIGLNQDQKMYALFFCFGFSLLYTLLSGLSGVMATDFVQFIMAMFGSIFLAVVCVQHIGGLDAIIPELTANYGAARAAEITAMFPARSSDLFAMVLVFVCLQWWSAGNTDSGGYLAQRMIAAKNEKHSFLGMLWFNVAFYCLRPWPWILVGLCAAVLLPGMDPAIKATVTADPETGYIFMMRQFLPVGMLGLVVASFFAAYMSTIDTHLNWGASYLINDVYKRFIARNATERHYIRASWIATLCIAVCGAIVSLHMDSIREAWYVIAKVYAGLAVIYILRWFWWRINAWSEIGAMGSSILCLIATSVVIPRYFPGVTVPAFPFILYYVVPISVGVALLLTFATPPVREDKLVEFYRKVRPGGLGWKRIAAQVPGADKDPGPGAAIPGYVLSVIAVYCALFGVGKLLLGAPGLGLALCAVAVACGWAVWIYVSRLKWDDGSAG